MPRASVVDCLKNAREMSMLADEHSGEKHRRLMQIAEAWLKMADEIAREASKARIGSAPPEHRKAH